MALLDRPLVAPERRISGFRPLKVLHHFRKLVADKEDTEQVFHIIEALRDRRFERQAAAFYASPMGRRLLAGGGDLVSLLDDHDAIARLPDGTVGRAYLAFMQREGLSAAGLVAEYDRFRRTRFDDLLERYSNRLRDTHDLHHVLTGYGRDALGEACVLAFSYSQTPSWGTLFIAYAAAFQVRKHVPRRANIFAAVREAQRAGRAAAQAQGRIAEQEIAALLTEPLAAARARLNIAPPAAYAHAHAVMRAHGLDPLAQQLRAQPA